MADEPAPGGPPVPAEHQPPLPLERLILEQAPDEEAVPMDVVFVGGGPAGLAGAIELARLVREGNERGDGPGEIEIGVLEKAAELGEHCLSGAVVNPRSLLELFPDLELSDLPLRGPVEKEAVYFLTGKRSFRLPTPPTMRNHGNQVGSICEIVRWMGQKAEEAGVNVFPGFPVDSLLVDGGRVIGVRTTPSGLDRKGEPGGADYMPPMDLSSRVTVLAEGTRGPLTEAWLRWQEVESKNPQIYALGVKELWEVKRPLDRVIHTMGWPLPSDAFGGSFMYPMADDLVALGLVVGMDYRDARLDVHRLLQAMKGHPLFREVLERGELVEWGGKTIPEGGYYSVAERRHGDGLLVVGDAAGYVDVPSLKGIHYAVQSGIFAARAIYDALAADDVSGSALRPYTEAVDDSWVMEDLHRTRNMRLSFKSGFLGGGLKSAVLTATRGRFPGRMIGVEEDAAEPREMGDGGPSPAPGDELSISKVDAVFKSGNKTRDDIPQHLVVGEDVPAEIAELYVHMCPAGVYEREGDELIVNAPNCIDCKATDVLGPRWTPREGGSGPGYRRM